KTTNWCATHQFEALDTFEQGDDLTGRLEHLRITLVVLEADACLTWHQPVDTRAPDEPEQDDELENHQERDVEQLEDQVQARGNERAHDVPLRKDHEESDECERCEDEQRPHQHPDPPEGAVDLAVELVVLVHPEVQVERPP